MADIIPAGIDKWTFVASDEAKMCLNCKKKASQCHGTCKFNKKDKKKKK